MASLLGLIAVAVVASIVTWLRWSEASPRPEDGVRALTPMTRVEPVFSLERQAEEAGDAGIGLWRRWPSMSRGEKLSAIDGAELGTADRIAPWLRPALTDADAAVRAAVLSRAAATGWEVFLPLLLHGLGAEDMQVKLAAVEGLVAYRSPLVKRVWLRLLAHPNRRFRDAAARGLATFGGRDVITPLLGRYRQADAEERQVLAGLLCKLRDARVKEVELRRCA